MSERVSSICRFCHAQCAIHVELDRGKPIRVDGVKDHPIYHGYACAKGRELPRFHDAPDRLLHPQRRGPDGRHHAIASATAMDDIATRLAAIRERHGERAISLYIGTHGYNNLASTQLALAFMEALGSKMVFTSVTIDQPGKAISQALHGTWLAGASNAWEADSWLVTGANPIVSMLGPVNPAWTFKHSQARGMKLIVIDPRRTELARRADLHLQARPGQDPVILAGLLQVIFREGLHDAAFLARHTRGLEALQAAVSAYTPEFVAARTGLQPEEIVTAARLYAGGRRGVATVGTGPNMSGHGNLTEYLSKVLMSVCGHWLQAGDPVPNPGVFVNPMPALAQAVDPMPAWGFGEQLRVRGLTDTAAGLPTAALADEILLPGDGQVRALIVLGGNPMMAWPDQLKTREAMDALELLVCVEPVMSATARLAHYVIPPKLTFEMAGCSVLQEFLGVIQGWGYPRPYGQWADPLVEPPPGSDVIEDWELFYGLAQRLGLALSVKPVSHLDPAAQAREATALDMQQPPSSEALWEILLKGSPIPLSEVRKYPDGHVFDRGESRVAAGDPAHTGRLDVGNPVMLEELVALHSADPDAAHGDYRFRLVSRRLADVLNSAWHSNAKLMRRWRYNPAFMHPDDMAELGVGVGDVVEISSSHASIRGVVEPAEDVRRGVISMTHCFGDLPEDEHDVLTQGSNTGRLTPVDRDYDPYTGIPRMSTIPVNVRALVSASQAATLTEGLAAD
ncbi:MAG: molybdopterin dinucleotide-binding protein [Gammaproteobacteria bacterium]|nr:MAG: molybdopterin dinucleotide-binding protein [Gammaproteobacteria bacterium]